MEKAKVYYTDFKTSFSENIPQKLERLIKTAGIDQIDFKGKYVAIKMHFGEPGNLAFLRPNYAAVVVKVIKELGGKPFLTDCNTLYVGGRKNGLDHLDAAFSNGFSPLSTGCHVVIADGIKGTDEVAVPIEGGEYISEAKIGRAIMDADIFITLNHFKGHESTGFGGALKNIGMGCGSRAGKKEMHSAGKPHVHPGKCIGCGRCIQICAHDAPSISNGKASIDQDKCVGCGRCVGVCPMKTILEPNDSVNDVLNKKIAEYSLAVCQNRPHFHISIARDISPNCDCHSENDIPIIPDIGMFASFDPVAIDMACADAANEQPVMAGSQLDRMPKITRDHFINSAPDTNWRVGIEHAVKLGLGTDQYEKISI